MLKVVAANVKTMGVLVVLCGALMAPSAYAAPIFDTIRTGIDGLDIGGTIYDVTFTSNATFPDVYGTTLPFTVEADATAAVQAILDFLNLNVGKENLSTTLNPAPLFQELRVPFEFTNGAETIFNFRRGQGQDLVVPQWSVPVTTVGSTSIFAQATETSQSGSYWVSFAVVPEPSTGTLLATGLLGLVVTRRRRGN